MNLTHFFLLSDIQIHLSVFILVLGPDLLYKDWNLKIIDPNQDPEFPFNSFFFKYFEFAKVLCINISTNLDLFSFFVYVIHM